MKASNKTVLFARITHNKQTFQWPVGVFANDVSARTFAAHVKIAHSNGDVETAKRLDPESKVDEAGKLIPGIKFAVKTVAYEPSAVAALGDEDFIAEAPTS